MHLPSTTSPLARSGCSEQGCAATTSAFCSLGAVRRSISSHSSCVEQPQGTARPELCPNTGSKTGPRDSYAKTRPLWIVGDTSAAETSLRISFVMPRTKRSSDS